MKNEHLHSKRALRTVLLVLLLGAVGTTKANPVGFNIAPDEGFKSMKTNAQQTILLRSTDKSECLSSDMTSLKASFSFSTIEAQDYESQRGTFSWLSLPNTVIGGNEGDPQIPVVNQLIAVPVGANPRIEITSYTTTDYRLEDYGIHTLVPRQPSLRKDQRPEEVPFVMNESAYQTRGFSNYPKAIVNVVGTMRGIRLGKMTIEPVSYDPVNNTLRVFNDIEVEVHFDGADAQATEDMLISTYSPYFDIVYKQMFNGRTVLDVYSDHPDLYTTPVKMLVITTSKYSSSTPFQNWLIWKKQKGIYVDVQTVANNASASSIRSLIQSKYNANHPTFLVIVGDENDITNYTTYTIASGSHNPYVSDNEYASVDSDVYHDMYMSRMCVSTTTELGNLVNKIMEYEQYTMPDPSYLSKVLLIAGSDDLWNPRVGQPTINYAADRYFNAAHGFNNVYKYLTSYTNCYNNMSTGIGFANYTGHGEIKRFSSPIFTTDDVITLTNTHKYFWAMGNCCLTANWGDRLISPCLGEALICAKDKGAFGYIGSIPETFWYEDYYFAVGATMVFGRTPLWSETTTGVYDALYDISGFNTLNSVPYIGNVAVTYAHANGYYSSVSDEYYWRAYQCLGDGSVMPYFKEPTTNNVNHDSNLPIGATSFTVNAYPNSYVAITVNNEIIGVAQVPASGTVDVPITAQTTPGTAKVVVTRYLRKPYIQNIIISGEMQTYTITVSSNPTNGGSVTGGNTYQQGASCTVTATPATGYSFQKWTVNGVQVSTNANYTFTVTGNRSLVAHFQQSQSSNIVFADANVKSLCVSNWDTNGDGELSYTEAAAVTDLNSVFENNSVITNFDELQYFIGLTSIGEDEFENCSRLASIVIPNSMISIGTTAFFNCSGLTSITVLADDPPYLSFNAFFGVNKGIPVNVPCGNLEAYENANGWNEFTNIQENCGTTCTISASANPTNGGSVNGGGNYQQGQSCTVTATANSGYTFTNWTENGTQVSTNANYTFNVTGNRNLVANFTSSAPPPQTYAITVSANPTNGGSVSGGGDYQQGQSCTVTATPNTEYFFTKWTENGTLVSTNCSYTFTVSGNRNLVANFIEYDDTCPIYFYLYDSYGDGWNGNCLVVEWDQGIDTLTIENGSGGLAMAGLVSSGSTISLSWIPNLSITECSFDIKFENGIIIYHGSNLNANFQHEQIINCEESYVPEENIVFADANVKALCIANWDTDGDSELSYVEAAAVTDLGTVFRYNSDITSFDELQYFIGLTSINNLAFYYCTSLTSIVIPCAVTSIGNLAFSHCNGLEQIVVDPINPFYDSRDNCNAIIQTHISELLIGCMNTIVPNTVTSIGYGAFSGCIGLTSIVIPTFVDYIGDFAFSGCSGLEQIIVDSCNNVFDSRDNCNAIIKTSTNELVAGCKNTVIPNSVTSIGNIAFYYCSSLTSIEIPNSVTSIGYNAFNGCTGLTSMIVLADIPPTTHGSTFNNVNKGIPVYVPCGLLEIYQTATGWSEFTNIQEMCTQTQTLTLSEGWNWCSFNVDITLDDLKTALVEALPGTTITISSQTQSTSYIGSMWRGQLSTLDVSMMYKIMVAQGCELTLEGVPVRAAEHPVTISNGYNWIAFPLSQSMSLSDAFAGFAVSGDVVSSQTQNATYNGTMWRGTLGSGSLEPGKGYKYHSNASETRTFTFPASAK